MNISNEMLRDYIEYVTVGWFNREDLPPDDVQDYRPRVENMILEARRKGDLEDLQLGIESLLVNSSENLQWYVDRRYPFDADEAKAILDYISSVLRQVVRSPSPSEIEAVRIVPMTLDDWWRERGR